MKGFFRALAPHAFAVCMTGCVAQGPSVPTAVVTPQRAKVVAADRLKGAVVIGKSTRADVIASLGETLVVRFDTGYEVWVYRLNNDMRDNSIPAQRTPRAASEKAWPPTPAEFVILFAPPGVVAKTRIRPAPP